jgi:hypothetical protein
VMRIQRKTMRMKKMKKRKTINSFKILKLWQHLIIR